MILFHSPELAMEFDQQVCNLIDHYSGRSRTSYGVIRFLVFVAHESERKGVNSPALAYRHEPPKCAKSIEASVQFSKDPFEKPQAGLGWAKAKCLDPKLT